jgi:hypothetical protein
MWNLNWFRSGGGSGETVYVPVEDVVASILEDVEIKALMQEDNLMALIEEDDVVVAVICDSDDLSIIKEEKQINTII